ncbi:MAG: tRNA (N(6)-L-threonylcarbamoyladenosine(37)-C(2))-methylthiotransferase MtaB [Dongiaceae bacterium]
MADDRDLAAPEVLTFGCRLNAWESEVMRRHAAAAGLGAVVLVNSCAVTGEAERQVRQAIRRARRERPEARILVTGCAAQIDPARFAAMPEVDAVIGNAEKLRPETFARLAGAAPPRVAVADIMTVRETAGHLLEGFEGRARAFLQVQQGCDHRCTFCIIPYGRGPSRSVAPEQVVAQARRLVEGGCNEIVLTGVDLTSWGGDLADRPSLGALARRLLDDLPELPRLRISSLDPAEIDAELWALIAGEPRLMPHLHLSLQAGDDLILKRMKRRHGRADAVATVRRARAARPDMAFGADLIAGFPTEDEDAFRRSLDLVEECELAFLHVFPFSARAGTPAARMPQLPVPVRRERARLLREAGAAARARFLAGRVGRPASLLVEAVEDGRAVGHSEHFAPLALDRPAPLGAVVAAEVLAADGTRLSGRLAA